MMPAHDNQPRSVEEMRRRDLAFIHVAKKQLGLAEDTYRALVSRFSDNRTDSAGELRVAERIKLMDHLRAAGAGVMQKGRGGDGRDQASKLRALWRSLYQLGEVEQSGDDALAAFVMRQTGIEALRWNRSADLNKGIESLKGWCIRIGYEAERCDIKGPCIGRFEPGLIRAQWKRLIETGAMRNRDPALGGWLMRRGYSVDNTDELTIDFAQDAVRVLGAWLRRERRKLREAVAV
jgi:hypothetical protein